MKKKMFIIVMLSAASFATAQITTNPIFTDPNTIRDFFGKTFVYNNVTNYTQDNAPYPYVEGRLRAGKYKSSETAFNSYVEQWKGYKNKVFKLLKSITVENAMGWLLESEEGDTIFYNMQAMPVFHLSMEQMTDAAAAKNTEFVSVDYLEYLKKSILNKEYAYLGCPVPVFDPQNPMYKPFCVKNLKTGELEGDLPLVKIDDIPTFSIWTVKEITLINGLPYAIINNKQFGDYQIWIWNNQFEDINKDNMKKGDESLDNVFSMVFVNKGSLCQSLKQWVDKAENQTIDLNDKIKINMLSSHLYMGVSAKFGYEVAGKIDLIHGEDATPERLIKFLKNFYEKIK